jgi:hypothetical protein
MGQILHGSFTTTQSGSAVPAGIVEHKDGDMILAGPDLSCKQPVPLSARWMAKLWRSVCTVTRLSMPASVHAERQAECRTWTSMGLVSSRPGKPDLGSRQPPVDPQDREQLR